MIYKLKFMNFILTVLFQEELESLKQQLAENQKAMEDLEKSWQQRLAEERKKVLEEQGIFQFTYFQFGGEDRTQIDARRKTDPYLWNLNEDAALTDMLIYFIEEGENRIGKFHLKYKTISNFRQWPKSEYDKHHAQRPQYSTRPRYDQEQRKQEVYIGSVESHRNSRQRKANHWRALVESK